MDASVCVFASPLKTPKNTPSSHWISIKTSEKFSIWPSCTVMLRLLRYFIVKTAHKSVHKPVTSLLSARLHLVSLGMKLIYSIITHLGKLLSRCQHNLLPSALMAAQLWMVDGYLIGETTSHWALQGGTKWETGKDCEPKEQRTPPVPFA